MKKYEFLADDPSVNSKMIMTSLIIGAFFAILNETLLNVALTTIMEEFEVTLTTVQWMATGFMLVMGIILPISALIIQWFTTRQIFLGTMIIFVSGTIIAACAQNFPMLLTGRMIQAVGTGALMPVLFNVMLVMYKPAVRGKIMGIIGFVIMFAPAMGPTLSGVIVEYLGWRYLFIIVVPCVLFALIFASKYLVNVSEVTKPKIDVLSVLLSTIGFGGTIYGFSSVGQSETGFSSPVVIVSIIIGLLAIVLFAWRQFKLEEPIMNLRVLKYPLFLHAIAMFLIIVMTMFATEIILPVYMQTTMLVSAAVVGMAMLPGSLLNGFLSPFMGALFDKVGPRVMMIPATAVLSVVLYFYTKINPDTSVWMIVVGFALIMVSISATMMPAQTNGLNQLPKELYPHGSAVMSTLQPLGGAIGVSVFISILNSKKLAFLANNPGATENEAMTSAVEFVYTISFIGALLTFVLALFVRRAEPINLEEEK